MKDSRLYPKGTCRFARARGNDMGGRGNDIGGSENDACRKGFTLVELIIVVAVFIILGTAAMQSTLASQRQFRFNTTYNIMMTMMRKARDLSVSNSTVPDTTDFDKDGQYDTDGDRVLPLGYGAMIVPGILPTQDHKITLYTDMPGSTKQQFDASDIELETFTFDVKTFNLYMTSNTLPVTQVTSYYEPPYGLPKMDGSYYITLSESGGSTRQKSILLNQISGIPEPYSN